MIEQQKALNIASAIHDFCRGYFGSETPDGESYDSIYFRDGRSEPIPNGDEFPTRWDRMEFKLTLEGFLMEYFERGARVVRIDLQPSGYLRECLYYGQRLVPDVDRLPMEEILGKPLPEPEHSAREIQSVLDAFPALGSDHLTQTFD